MTRYLIKADTPELAMRRAKEAFGASAIVIDTQNKSVKSLEGMAVKSETHMVVSPGGAIPSEHLERVLSAGDITAVDQSAGVEQIRAEISRVERLIRSVERADQFLRATVDKHPLAGAMREAGVRPATMRGLREGAVAGDLPEFEANHDARKRLLARFRTSRITSLEQMRGPHVFMGASGSGKTSVVLSLAAELVQRGLRTAVVAIAPPHHGEVRRIEEAARALRLDAAVARDVDEVQGALAMYSNCDAVLIDTPCALRSIGAARQVLEKLGALKTVFKHHVVAANRGFEEVVDEVDACRRLGADYVVWAQLDLVSRPGRLLDVVMSRDLTTSLLSRRGEQGVDVEVATPTTLLVTSVPGVMEFEETSVGSEG